MISKLADKIKIYNKAMERYCSKQKHCSDCDFNENNECILLLTINYLKDILK